MKKLNLSFIALFAFAALLFTSCEEDIIDPDLGGGDGTPPSISLASEAGFIAADSEIELGLPLNFRVSITKGSADLRTLTVFEDGSELPLDRISLGANPALFVTDKGSQTLDIEIMPNEKEGIYTYAFEVDDEDGEEATISVEVTTIIPFTPIERSITGALLNQGGRTGTGGLDLDNGDGTGSRDEAAEIQDEGINTDLTAANNWRQQISGANDAEVVFIGNLGSILGNETLTFDDVEFKEQIADAFAGGTALDGDDSNCNCSDTTNGEAVSQPVQVDDIFAIKRGDVTYLIQCTAVNVTSSDNLDSYEFAIKY